MRRVQLIEIHDQPWFPSFLRDQVTDDLQVLLNVGKPYADIVPQLREGIERAGADRVLDLCSGAGGPWPWLAEDLERSGLHVPVELSDKYPNACARGWCGDGLFQSYPWCCFLTGSFPACALIRGANCGVLRVGSRIPIIAGKLAASSAAFCACRSPFWWAILRVRSEKQIPRPSPA